MDALARIYVLNGANADLLLTKDGSSKEFLPWRDFVEAANHEFAVTGNSEYATYHSR